MSVEQEPEHHHQDFLPTNPHSHPEEDYPLSPESPAAQTSAQDNTRENFKLWLRNNYPELTDSEIEQQAETALNNPLLEQVVEDVEYFDQRIREEHAVWNRWFEKKPKD